MAKTLNLELRAATVEMANFILNLQANSQVYILPHHRGDGDAYGSAFALAAILNKLSFKAQVITAEPVPAIYDYLDLPEYMVCAEVENANSLAAKLKQASVPTYVCLVDNSEPQTRLGARQALWEAVPEHCRLIIDHHVSHYQTGQGRDIEPKMIACCQQVAELAFALSELTGQVLLTANTANMLMTGIITDSGQLSYAAVTSQTYLLMAWLKALGADQELINRRHFHTISKAKLQVTAYVAAHAEFLEANRVLIGTLPIAISEQYQVQEQDIDGISSYLREVAGVEVAVLLRETAKGNVLGSIRSSANVDAQLVAAQLGGGGHVRAAGFTLYNCNLEAAKVAFLEALQAQIRN